MHLYLKMGSAPVHNFEQHQIQVEVMVNSMVITARG